MLKNEFDYKPLKLNLQFFAEGDEGEGEGVGTGESGEGAGEEVKLTTEELQKKVEAESDRKLAKALEKKEKEWEKQLEQKIADAKKDAEAYAKMTQKEKEDAEYQKRVEALEKRERELNNRQLLSEIETDLKDNKLPVEFAQSLLAVEDNEKIKESIKGIKKTFDEAVNNAVKEALRQDTPKGSTGSTSVTNDQFNKMTYEQKTELFMKDQNLFNQLSKGE